MQIATGCNMPILELLVFILYLSGIHGHRECGVLNSDDNSIPWNVNIYQKNESGKSYKFICSGTVISRKTILTAARCFYDDLTQKIRTATFILSVGQKYKNFNSSDDPNTELREIFHENIFIPDKYNGIVSMYANNIAVLKLNPNQKLTINAFVKTACVFWDNDFTETQLQVNAPPLKLAVWDDKTARLNVLQPSYLEFDLCSSLLPKNFRAFLTFDKMCAQLSDSSATPNIGAGLYVYNTLKNHWYLIGIASETTSLDSKIYVIFVKLKSHLNWISNRAFLFLHN